MYAIIDIETTGGNASGNRITEIAIFRHDGEKVIDCYHTLINPQQRIPPFIIALTGIDDEMVETAPIFKQVAQDILEFTENCIFVAHNVNFDYTFIKKEFQEIGIVFDRKKLCTVRLSRKIFPYMHSYSLGNLCGQLKIEITNRHRAKGDAEATVELFSMLLNNDTDQFIQKSLKKNSRETLLPAHVPRADFDALPEEEGVYYFHDHNGKVIYVGKAINIKKRVISHFSAKQNSKQSQHFMKDIHGISFETCGSELVSLLLESYEIKKNWPVYNRIQKKTGKNVGLYLYEDSNGYARISIADVSKMHIPVLSFRYIHEAREFLLQAVSTHQLCHRLCGLQKSVCSNTLMDVCEVCHHQIPFDIYNKKMEQALASFKGAEKTFVIKEKGRTREEYAVVLVELGRYLGYGYIQQDVPITGFEELKQYVNGHWDNQDIQKVLASYLRAGNGKVVMYF